MEQLRTANMELPVIVKPAAACGVAAAHSMAIVLHASGFADLRVPLPAVVQEYVDHGAELHKIYVLGSQVRSRSARMNPCCKECVCALCALGHTHMSSLWLMVCRQVYTHTKRSIPDLRLREAASQSAPAAVHFDSLQSMPLSFDWLPATATSPTETKDCRSRLDMAAVGAAATWLRAELQLRLLGFDVVVDALSGNRLLASAVAMQLVWWMVARLHPSTVSPGADMQKLSTAHAQQVLMLSLTSISSRAMRA